MWLLNGERHNPDGPAYRSWLPNGTLGREEWWLNGKELTKEDFLDRGIDFILKMQAESLFTIDEILKLATESSNTTI